jgi:hypothetical protein
MNRQPFIKMMILVVAITIQSNVCLSDDVKQKYSNVRLQQNKWVQILEQKEEIEYKEYLKGEVWQLHVKVLFLQYCKASKKKSRISEVAKDPSATEKEIAETIGEQFTNIVDYIVPAFRCNYQTTIFLTEYSTDGKELLTLKTIPIAPKNKTEIMPGETIWVTFILPINLPSDTPPKSWQVWVPK